MPNQINRRDALKVVGGASAAVGIAGCAGEADQTTLTMGTASEDTGAYALSQGIAAVVNENSDKLHIDAIPTAGSEQSVQLLDQGEIDIGFADRPHLYRIHNEIDQFEDDPFDNELVHLFYYYSLQMGLIGREGEVEELSDIEDARGSPYVEGASTRDALLNQIRYGVNIEELDLTSVEFGDLPSQMSAGQVDWCGEVRLNQGIVPAYIQELWSTVDDAVLVHWPDNVIEEALDDPLNDGVTMDVADLEDDYTRVGDQDEAYFPETRSDIVSRSDLDNDLVEELLRQITENADQIGEYHELGEFFDSDGDFIADLDTDQFPTHPASEEYFSEIGAGDF